MIDLIKKILSRKSESTELAKEEVLVELGSAVRESKNTSSAAHYFSSSDNFGVKEEQVIRSVDASYLEYDGHNFYKSPFDEYVVLDLPGSYPDCPTVMFECQEWIKRDYLKPIGRSRITGGTIYKYIGFKPNEDIESIGIEYCELF